MDEANEHTVTAEGQVTNRTGQVAMFYRNPNQSLWQSRIVFVPRFGISLAWVELADAPALLRFRGGCCGGTQQMYFFASLGQVMQWTTGVSR